MRQILQSVTDVYYKVRQVLQYTIDCHYAVLQVLQSVTVITMSDVTPVKLTKVDKTLERLNNKGLNEKNEMSLVSLILKAKDKFLIYAI